MDTDNDGIVTYHDAARYGKEKKKQSKQWKCLFVASIIILLITYGVVFGLFLFFFVAKNLSYIKDTHHT